MAEIRRAIEGGAAWLREAFAPAVAEVKAWTRPESGEAYVAVRKDHTLIPVPGVERARAKHVFDDPRSFAEWLNRHAADPERCEITLDGLGVGVARIGLEANGGDYAELRPPFDPTLSAFIGVLDRPQSQRDLQELVRGYGEALTDPKASDWLTMLGTLKVIQGDTFESQIDETGATRFSGRTRNQSVEGKVPPTVTLRTAFFQGVQRVDDGGAILEGEAVYQLELCVSFDHDGPTFTLTAPAWDRLKREAVLDLKRYLEALLAEGFLVGLGKLAREVVRCPQPRHGGEF